MADLNQRLEQKLQQKLSPQQIQLIKLLELPVVELEQRVKKELEDNPALEIADFDDENKEFDKEEHKENNDENTETSEDEYTDDILDDEKIESIDDIMPVEDQYDDPEDIPAYKLKDNNYGEETDSPQTFYSVGQSFQEYLLTQLSELSLTEQDRQIAEYIIGNIDDTGYLRRSLENIVSDLIFLQGLEVPIEKIEEILHIIQDNFEPAGVGARDLQECLILQVKRKLKENPDDEILNLTLTILSDFFEAFSKKHYKKIKDKLGIDDDTLRAVINKVLKLNPKPGNAYAPQSKKNVYQIIPDFILYIRDGKPVVELYSSNVPPLRVNKEYEKMLQNFQKKRKQAKEEKEASNFIKKKVNNAHWFIDAIEQRKRTLERTMQAILEYQYEFFRTGDENKLKPMILKDIADKTGLDISTISRVANSKYIQTPYGIYPLKYFFSEGLENSEGQEVSTRKIKSILKEAIEKEDKRKPLTDEKLAKLLQEKGYKIARRTVAKYREQMGIRVARLRKEV